MSHERRAIMSTHHRMKTNKTNITQKAKIMNNIDPTEN